MPDPLLTPFVRNVSVPNSSGIQPGEGFSSSASDISSGKGYDPDIFSGKGYDPSFSMLICIGSMLIS